MPPFPKDLTQIDDLSTDQILFLFQKAKKLKTEKSLANPKGYTGKNVALFFFEPSTRTRCSFEIATLRLGHHPLVIQKESSSTTKGETLLDTALNLEAMGASCLVVRHSQSGVLQTLKGKLKIPVINAGDGKHEHPTQALLDAFTLWEKDIAFKSLKILIVGDILHSRVAHSLIKLFSKFGSKISVCGPLSLMPSGIENWGVTVFTDYDDALKDQDVVIPLRIQKERLDASTPLSLNDFSKNYQLNSHRQKSFAPKAYILSPGPINIDVELTREVVDSPQSLILQQVENGTWIRMAVLDTLMGGTHA